MVNANFDGGASASITGSFTGWGGVDSSSSYGVDLPTTGNSAFNGTKPVYVTTARFFVAGKGGSRSIRVGIGGQYSGYVTVASGGSAVAKDFTLNKVFANGGSNLTTRIDENGTGGFYFGRGADGTGSSIDDNGNTWSGSLSGYATYVYVPTAPTSPSVVQSGGTDTATVSWSVPSSDGGSAVTGYVIHYSTLSSFTSYTTVVTGSTSTSHTIGGLTYGQTYYFRVLAVNAAATAAGTTSLASSAVSLEIRSPGTDGWTSFGTYPSATYVVTQAYTETIAGVNQYVLSKSATQAPVGTVITKYTTGLQRVFTGLEVGKVYKLNMFIGSWYQDTTGNNICRTFRVGVVGKTFGADTLVNFFNAGANPATAMPEYTFTATSTTHTIQIQSAEDITVGSNKDIEYYAVHDITLTREAEDLTSTKGYWIQDNLFSGSLADHYQLTMDSVGGYWWVDKQNKTQFSQEKVYQLPVGTFTDGYELVGGVPTPGQSLPGELHYNTIEVGYKTESVVNDITISNEGLSPTEGNDTMNQAWQASWNQKNETSKTNWGTRKAELKTNLWLENIDNIVANPSFEVDFDTARNSTGTTNSAVKRIETTSSPVGNGKWVAQHKVKTGITTETSLDLYVGDSVTGNGGDYDGIVVGQAYSATAYVRKTGTTQAVRAAVQIRFYDNDNQILGLGVTNYVTLTTAETWYTVTQTHTAPLNAVSALVRLVVNKTDGSAIAAGTRVQWDGVGFVKGSTPIYFDGNFTDTTSYIYDWLGSEQQSMSRRSVNRLTTRATDILADFADPVLTVDKFTWNAAENPIVAANLDVGSLLYLKFNGVNTLYRAVSLSHEVTPDEWLITVEVQKASI